MTGHWAPHAREISDAYGSFLSRRDWSFLVHLTVDDRDRRGTRFGRPWTGAGVAAEFRRFHRRLETMARGPVPFVRVIEGASIQHFHIHALLGSCASLTPELVRHAWKGGFSEAERFDPTRRGAYYATKFVGFDPDSIDLSENLPAQLAEGASGESLAEVGDSHGCRAMSPDADAGRANGCPISPDATVATQSAGVALTDSVGHVGRARARVKQLPLIKGTLDLLVLRALAGGKMYGSEIRPWLVAQDSIALRVHGSAIYQSLYRLAAPGFVSADLRPTGQGRRARCCYALTASGRDRLHAEANEWRRYAAIVSRLLGGEILS